MKEKGKILKYGNHMIGNDTDGYMYNLNVSNGYDFASHMHGCFEFLHVIEGDYVYTVEDSEYKLSSGDFMMTKPSEMHSFAFPKPCLYRREFLHIYPGFLQKHQEVYKWLMSRKSGYYNRIPAVTVKKYGIDAIFRDIESCCENPQQETDVLVLADTLRLAAKINQIMRDEEPEEQRLIFHKKASEAIHYIDRHYFEPLTVATVAAAVYMSPTTLSHVFAKEMGISVKRYINMRRITRAKNLIMEGHKCSNVATICGFDDYSTFYRAFKTYTGMTAEEFRRIQIGKAIEARRNIVETY